MATPNPDTTGVKVESSTENGNADQNVSGGSQKFGGHQRRGGGNRGGGGRGGGRFGQNQHQQGRVKNEGGFGGGQKWQGGQGGGGGGGGFHGERSHGERGPGEFRPRNPMEILQEKLHQIAGPTLDLPPLDMAEKKFSGRNRLYIGNTGNEITDEDVTEFFKPYGETSELFLNKEKSFGFIKFDFYSNAEKAKRELDGTALKGRNLKLRFAPSNATIKVKNLPPFVTNELLHHGFQVFGEIERAIVSVDERGKPTGEGIVEFVRKGNALNAIRNCNEGCFFLTGSLRPCIVESYDIVDDSDGYSDKNIMRRNPEFQKAREVGPRFATDDTFEHEYGMRWKQLHELFAQKEQALKKELEMEKEKLEAQMEFARYEHETEMLREQLRVREMDRERTKREWEMKERQAEEQRQRSEEQMRRQEEDLQARMIHQEEDLRRRQQENTLFMQAHQLDNMLEQQEQAYDRPAFPDISGDSPVVEPKALLNSYERESRFDSRGGGGDMSGNRGGNKGGAARGHWVNDSRRDDYPMKRRRF